MAGQNNAVFSTVDTEFFAGLSGDLSSTLDGGGGGELKQKYICDICGVNFPCRTYLNRHLKNVHVEANAEHQKCPKCSMTFKRYDTFWEHVIRVHENPSSSSTVGEVNALLTTTTRNSDASPLEGDQPQLVVPETEEEIETLVDSLVSEEDDKVCKRCGKRFCGKTNVKRHIREVHLKLPPSKNSSGRVSCEKCGKSFVNNSVYNSHMRNIHLQPEPTIECPKCWKKFKEMKALRRHLKDVHLVQAETITGSDTPLSVTTTSSNSKTDLPNAQDDPDTDNNDEEDTIFSCATCEISFVSLDGLNRHKKNVHRIAVPEAPSKFLPSKSRPSTSNLVLRLVQGDDEDQQHECQECGKKFSSKNALWGHAVVHQKASLEPHIKGMLRAVFGVVCNSKLTCGICGTTVSNSIEGRLHVYIKHPEKFEELVTNNTASSQGLVQCTHCSEKLPSSEAMISHLESCHPDKHIPTCPQCGHKELKERDINLHFKQFHPEVSRYSCDVCKRPFNQRRDLQNHMSREHSAYAVQCPYCPEKHVKVKLHVTVKHPEKAEEYAQWKRDAIREEQLARKRFNQFLEKGLTKTATAGKTRKFKKVATKQGKESDISSDGEEEYNDQPLEDEPEDESENPDNPEYEDDEDDEVVDRKPNVCFVKETPKVTIPELYTLEKNTTTPHLIEVHRLPPPPPPPPEPEQVELVSEIPGTEGPGEAPDNELDVKPDVNQLKISIITKQSSSSSTSHHPPEKTLKLCLKRLTQDEIAKWKPSTNSEVLSSTSCNLSSSSPSKEISSNTLSGKRATFTSRRGRKRRRR